MKENLLNQIRERFSTVKNNINDFSSDGTIAPRRAEFEQSEDRALVRLIKATIGDIAIVSTVYNPRTGAHYKMCQFYGEILKERNQFRGLDSY